MDIIETKIPVADAIMLIPDTQIAIGKVPVVTGALPMPIVKPEFQIMKPKDIVPG